MNLKEFQNQIEFVGKGLGPDDDWMPVLFLEKDKAIAVIGMMLMENDAMKDLCAYMLTKVISLTNPDSACFITTAWMSEAKDKYKEYTKDELHDAFERGYITRPSKDPDRIEIVNALCIGVRGENDGEAFMVGRIQRNPGKPPTIKKWDVHDEPEINVTGRFADAMKKGFASVDIHGDLSRLEKLKGSIDGRTDTE